MDKKQFTIKIENLVPTLVDIDAKIPCDNDGYSINFAFDDDWGNYRVKTGIFVCGGATHTSVFEGNICKVPRIKDGRMRWRQRGSEKMAVPTATAVAPAIMNSSMSTALQTPPMPRIGREGRRLCTS